jgi:hypothetical protein
MDKGQRRICPRGIEFRTAQAIEACLRRELMLQQTAAVAVFIFEAHQLDGAETVAQKKRL